MKVLLIVILLLLLVTCLCVANKQEKEKMLKRQINSIENCNYLDTLNNSDMFSNRTRSHFRTNCISVIASQTAYSKR